MSTSSFISWAPASVRCRLHHPLLLWDSGRRFSSALFVQPSDSVVTGSVEKLMWKLIILPLSQAWAVCRKWGMRPHTEWWGDNRGANNCWVWGALSIACTGGSLGHWACKQNYTAEHLQKKDKLRILCRPWIWHFLTDECLTLQLIFPHCFWHAIMSRSNQCLSEPGVAGGCMQMILNAVCWEGSKQPLSSWKAGQEMVESFRLEKLIEPNHLRSLILLFPAALILARV